MWDVRFGRDANYFNTQSTPNDSYSSIDEGTIASTEINNTSYESPADFHGDETNLFYDFLIENP